MNARRPDAPVPASILPAKTGRFHRFRQRYSGETRVSACDFSAWFTAEALKTRKAIDRPPGDELPTKCFCSACSRPPCSYCENYDAEEDE